MTAGVNVPGGTGGNGVSGRKKGKGLVSKPWYQPNMIPETAPIGAQAAVGWGKAARQVPAKQRVGKIAARAWKQE